MKNQYSVPLSPQGSSIKEIICPLGDGNDSKSLRVVARKRPPFLRNRSFQFRH